MLKQKRIALITMAYWFLLLYAILALLFWFISLNNQNKTLTQLKITQLNITAPHNYATEFSRIINIEKRKKTQFLAEGITFFVVLSIGAWFVYRSLRKQLKLSQQQQNFLMAVTHELKTPIAITQLNLETLQKRNLDATQQQKIIGNTLQEANRLNVLCNNILLSSQIESGVFKPAKQNISFSLVVEQAVESFKKRFPARKFEVYQQDNYFIEGEKLLLEMLVNNLIDNAIKYSLATTIVTIELKKQNNKIILSVKDEGVGINEEEKQHLFKKFYRIQNEATRTTKGTGLGLYLCKKIANYHSGNIKILNNQPLGTVFEVTLNI